MNTFDQYLSKQKLNTLYNKETINMNVPVNTNLQGECDTRGETRGF